MLLCEHHHHRVHENGWRVRGDANGMVSFVSRSARDASRDPRRSDEDAGRDLDPVGSNILMALPRQHLVGLRVGEAHAQLLDVASE